MKTDTPSHTIASDVLSRARDWCAKDPNETTANYVQSLLDSSDSSFLELQSLFPDDRISFGTAGLRSTMKPGPMGMNDLVVLQTAQGIARYCSSSSSSNNKLCAVVGYDHRANPAMQLSSLSFAILTAIVFLEAGWECLLLYGFAATPLVPFCVQQLKATIGIMITASHNPKQDAGYKVYWSDACQIRSPIDKGIADAILSNLEPWTNYRSKLQQLKTTNNDPCLGLSQPARTKELTDAYFHALTQSSLVVNQSQLPRGPKICYTAMHGVGHAFAVRSFQTFGLQPFVSVPDQQDPDPAFPTVVFPNPEEKGALSLAKTYAEQHGCQIVLANDPDVDRLAVAEYNGKTWTVLTGDQIGALLGYWLFQTQHSNKPMAMCASTASSKLLAEIARKEGFYFEDTLTGFKWIGSRAAELHASGYNTVFCYEEAIGYCCGSVVFDKDGVSALGVFGQLTRDAYSRGMTLTQQMQRLYDKYGEFVSNNGYYFVQDLAVVPKILNEITNGGKFDTLGSVGPYAVTRVRYLGEPGYDSSTLDRKPTLPTSASSPMLTLWFENGCVAQFRASGTEPKFKYYIELKGRIGAPRSEVAKELQSMSAVILEELLHPFKNGLRQP